MVAKPKQSSEHRAAFATGGKTRMLSPQAAGPQKPGVTAHAVKGAVPGPQRASGGPSERGSSSSTPAKAGHTAPPRKGR